MENVSSSNGLEKCPKLRFPEFTKPWECVRIGDVYAERNERGAENAELLSVTMKEGVKRRSDIEGKDNSSEDKGNYKVVHVGDMVYNSMRMWQGANGISTYDGIVSPAYTVMTPKVEIANGFFAALFKTHHSINEFCRHSQGMTSDTWNLKYPQIETIKAHIPSVEEQKKIADLLATLDERIENQRQLVEYLKKYKRGVIKKIFSRKIRFELKDGTAFPEWEEYALEDVVEFLDGQRKPLESAERAIMKGEYPYYGASGIIDYINNYIFDEPLLLLGEDGANIITRSSPLCFIATGKYWVNNHAHVMRPKQGFDSQFVCEALESIDYTKYNTGTAQPKLNQEKCRKIVFYYPCYDEQIIIAKFISRINKKIQKAEKQLSIFEAQKKALLQQLFI